jgi:hypothetical protein
MKLARYAPSGQFTVIALSLLISGGLVYAAERVTHPASSAALAVEAGTNTSDADNWQAALYEIQAQNASTSLTTPNQQTVSQMLQAAQSGNITDSVGKTLLINLSNAKAQGLGDDIPTQDQIVAAAAAQIAASKPASYTVRDLTVVKDSNDSLKTYGNSVIQILTNHQDASEKATLLAVSTATDHNDPSQLKKLPAIAAAYKAILSELLATPVPQTLSPLHVAIINSYSVIVAAYPDMQVSLSDPLRGIVGLQTYEAQLDTLIRLYTNIAGNLNKDGILFSKSEPGSVWQSFLTSP